MASIGIKMKRSFFLSILLVGVSFLYSCDKAYELKMSKSEGTLPLPCGSVTVRTKAMGNQLFFIRQQYELIGELWVNPDSLRIIYKSNNIDFSLWRHDTGEGVKGRTMITGKTTLQLDFSIINIANKGDTVFIVANGFLNCQGQNILSDTISIFVDR